MANENLDFVFERRAGARGAIRRKDDNGATARLVILRWGLSEEMVTSILSRPSLRVRLDRYCTEYPLNIDWYERHHDSERRSWRLLIAGAVTLAALPLLATFLVLLRDPAMTPPLLVPLFGALLASGYGVLKVVGTAVDVKARFAGFWRAAANLKERLYSFEETWSGREITVGTGFTEEFLAQLESELLAGRAISREEREAFFATFAAPLAVLEVAKTSYEATLDELGGALATTAPARRPVPAATPRKDTDPALSNGTGA